MFYKHLFILVQKACTCISWRVQSTLVVSVTISQSRASIGRQVDVLNNARPKFFLVHPIRILCWNWIAQTLHHTKCMNQLVHENVIGPPVPNPVGFNKPRGEIDDNVTSSAGSNKTWRDLV